MIENKLTKSYRNPQESAESLDIHSEISKKKNHLANAAAPLITLINQLRHAQEYNDVMQLRTQIIVEINSLRNQLVLHSYPEKIIKAAQYCLCTVIDEVVLSSAWGMQSLWIQESLLSLFYQETYGGERFYIIAEAMLDDVKRNMDFIELIYILLSLGFEGKFHGKLLPMREDILNKIFYRIRNSKEKPDRTLSNHWVDVKPVQNYDKKQHKTKAVILVCITVFMSSLVYYNFFAVEKSKKLLTLIDKIANISPVVTFSQAINRPLLLRKAL